MSTGARRVDRVLHGFWFLAFDTRESHVPFIRRQLPFALDSRQVASISHSATATGSAPGRGPQQPQAEGSDARMRMATRDDNPLLDLPGVKTTTAPYFTSEDVAAPPPRFPSTSPSSTQPRASPVPNGELRCPLCPSRFKWKRSLEMHIKAHPGETDYVCPAQGCGKRFSTTGNLARHRRRHGYIPPLQCPADRCTYSTNAAHKLARHMKIHRDTSMRACEYPGCGKKFATTGNLNRHIRTQHARSPGARPGRPRGSSVGRLPAAPPGLVESAEMMEGLRVSDATTSAAPIDFCTGAERCRDRKSNQAEDAELLATLSLFLDNDSPQSDASVARGSEGTHETLECSEILDELAKFHAAHSPV
jgi:hypothetical protein